MRITYSAVALKLLLSNANMPFIPHMVQYPYGISLEAVKPACIIGWNGPSSRIPAPPAGCGRIELLSACKPVTNKAKRSSRSPIDFKPNTGVPDGGQFSPYHEYSGRSPKHDESCAADR
jgi:hypothetical protein